MIGRITWNQGVRQRMQIRIVRNARRMSPGTGRIKSPIFHSPLVPALLPMGGRPPTWTILKTSTSSCTRPERARAIVADKQANSWASLDASPRAWEGEEGDWSFTAERVLRRNASVSRIPRRRSRSVQNEINHIECVRVETTNFCHYPAWALQGLRGSFPLSVASP